MPFAPGTFWTYCRALGNYPETGFREVETAAGTAEAVVFQGAWKSYRELLTRGSSAEAQGARLRRVAQAGGDGQSDEVAALATILIGSSAEVPIGMFRNYVGWVVKASKARRLPRVTYQTYS